MELQLQYQSSLSNEYSGLISFRVDWFDLLAVQRTLESFLQHENVNSLALSLLYGPTLTSIHGWKWKYGKTILSLKVQSLNASM